MHGWPSHVILNPGGWSKRVSNKEFTEKNINTNFLFSLQLVIKCQSRLAVKYTLIFCNLIFSLLNRIVFFLLIPSIWLTYLCLLTKITRQTRRLIWPLRCCIPAFCWAKGWLVDNRYPSNMQCVRFV